MAGVLVLGAFLTVGLASAGRRVGAAHPEPVALGLAPVVGALSLLLAPVARLVGLAVTPLAGGPGRFTLPLPPIEEVERALAAHARSRDPADHTSELIHRVLEFREKVARDIMVPRTDVMALDVETPVPRSSGGSPRRGTPASRSSREASTGWWASCTPATSCRCSPTPSSSCCAT